MPHLAKFSIALASSGTQLGTDMKNQRGAVAVLVQVGVEAIGTK